jgi:hypothetical protein
MPAPNRLFWLLFLCCLTATPALAHPRGSSAPYVVEVMDEAGRELRTFHHAGQTFVLGRYGERYSIRVQNHTGRRVEAVVTVDGRDVISGTVGDFVGESGYLIDAYDTVVIDGFRQSLDEVAAFRFTRPENSYSARMGTPENVGMIGIAIFPERVHEQIVRRAPPMARRADERAEGKSASAQPKGRADAAELLDGLRSKADRAASAGAAAAPSTDNLGTSYGESLSSSAQEVPFERASRTEPAALIALRYDDRDGLLARGIAVDPPRPRPVCGPQPFPRNGRFAPPPPAWRD